MHLTLTLFDSEAVPRSFLLEVISPQAETILTPRILRAIRLAIGANRVTTDNLSPVSYPSIPAPEAEKFEAAYIALYMNPEAFRQVMKDPSSFERVLRRFLPKDPK